MVTHKQIWLGIDALARRHSLTASGLARRAGLDPTTFNPSKRFQGAGAKPRWPSTESIAKALQATGASLREFAALADGGRADDRPLDVEREPADCPHLSSSQVDEAIPLLCLAEASADGVFDAAGYPAGGRWGATPFPAANGTPLYALEVAGDALAPLYRPGDRIIVSPGQEVRSGDRIVVKTVAGEVLARELGRVSGRQVELRALGRGKVRLVDVAEIVWMARVLWSSQSPYSSPGKSSTA